MIQVDLFKDKQGMIVGYKVSGHAGYSEEGTDIVCSAVSALTQAPLLGLERHLKLKPSYVVNQEDGILEAALNSAPTDLTQAILQTMVYGLQSIERQCPQYVRIQEHRR
ncbi:ribosomal-processing cysteine protease Prp [Phascolarctobacterium sp.]|uniref:ribosomal-processing cysteine protease Prp n=1 Tax=Phascolarctobacterium sp. TaxID=2049039 RepID=UPI0025EC52B1|nr:ribosomal-processing cysteine protease Prp [Phascolarctobacterium sp.]MDO4922321.1 ribosomal-processing cysteine protease Prp [Phascolarctobacterium sp.]